MMSNIIEHNNDKYKEYHYGNIFTYYRYINIIRRNNQRH